MHSVIEHTPPLASGDVRPVYGPAGDWADLPRFVAPGRPTDAQREGGRCIWLNDNQIDLTGADRRWLTRTVNEIVTPDGLSEVGPVSVDFDPTFERVAFHHVRILRDGVTRVFDPMPTLQVFQRERDLERARFDGRLTAHFVIPDLRLGDIVDVAWTITGGHPLLRDRFAAEWVFEWGCWVGQTRVRLLAGEHRDLRITPWGRPPEVQERRLDGGVVERIWLSRDTQPARREPDTPAWFRSLSGIACVEAVTWPEVAARFRPLYPLDTALPDDLEQEAVEIERVAPTPAERTVAALRLVQGALRYQAVTVGAGGFKPNPLDRIWASRSGDCKDASLLLTVVLRRLGVEACPALVNTVVGWTLADEPPALGVFDHCIVRATVDGAVYWLDPTNFPQGGRLEILHQPRWGWALPLVEGGDLQSMGQDVALDVYDVVEEMTFGSPPGSGAELTVRSIHRHWRADWMRRRLAAGRAALEEEFREFYARRNGGATVLAPLVVEEDLQANTLVMTERYALVRPWEKVEADLVRHQTVDDLFAPNLGMTPADARRMPLDLGHPRRMRHEILLTPGRPLSVRGWNETFAAAGVTLTSVHGLLDEATGASRLVKTLEVARRFIPAEETQALFDVRERALTYSGVSVTLDTAPQPAFAPSARASGKGGAGRDWAIRIIGALVLMAAASSLLRNCSEAVGLAPVEAIRPVVNEAPVMTPN